MKYLFFLSIALFSITASAFEFTIKTKGTECTITETQLTKKMSVGAASELSVTTTRELQFEGIKEFIEEVIAVSATYPQKNATVVYALKIDETTYYLNPNHSLRVQTLSALLSRLCF